MIFVDVFNTAFSTVPSVSCVCMVKGGFGSGNNATCNIIIFFSRLMSESRVSRMLVLLFRKHQFKKFLRELNGCQF